MLLPLLMGCTAVRGTIQLVEAEQDYSLAQASEAEELAIYAWTMAESYMHKSREEYAHADYEAAAAMAAKASEWSVKAKNIAEGNDISPLESAPNILPETLERTLDDGSGIQNAEDDLLIPGETPADPAEGPDLDDLNLDDIDPLEGAEEAPPEEEELNIDDILFEDEEDEEEDW